jgi:trk system potassium uptake protein TrkH
MSRLLPILHVLGLVILIFAFTMLVPLVAALFFHDAAQHAYDEAFLSTFLSGLGLWLVTRHRRRELQAKDGFLLVSLVWAGLPAFATLPFLIYMPALSFTDAYFEAVSGMTTTGSTVLTGLDSLPPSINLWRGLLVWIGGMGLIVLAVAILPLLGIGGRQMFKAETPGPMKDSQLTPRIAQTAKGLWMVYALISLACGMSYWAAGMSPFDAVMHAFTTMGLGGFSTHDASFGYWNSPLIEAVSIVFMLLAGVNFATHFLAFRNRSFGPYLVDSEAKAFWAVAILCSFGIAFFLWAHHVYPDFLTALRFAIFNTISIATSTGYANTNYNLWPIFAPLLMLLLSCFASSSGSTGGGIKMVRAMLLFKQGLRELSRLLHPQAQLPVKLQGQVIQNQIIYAVLAYLFLYLVSVVAMTLMLAASGLDFLTSFSAVIASINNTGPGLNQVGPATTYASLSDFQTWVCTFAMLLGRLELMTLFVLFTRTFWKS